MALQFYNTASRKKEVFTLPEGVPAVRMYCCGPTVYHFAHIGNLRTYIFEDFLVRTLKYYGYKVNHIVNITDVGHLTSDADSGDDKMEKGAAREGKSVWDIAKFYTDAFMADWHRLNIQEPTRWTPATQHIQEQIDLVKTLEEKGYTYRTSDGIYFDSLKFPRYADFARLDVENLRKGSRIDMGEKKNATEKREFREGDMVRYARRSPFDMGMNEKYYPPLGTVGRVDRVCVDGDVLVHWPYGTTADDGYWYCTGVSLEVVE